MIKTTSESSSGILPPNNHYFIMRVINHMWVTLELPLRLFGRHCPRHLLKQTPPAAHLAPVDVVEPALTSLK